MDQERASQEEITADERRCTQIRTVNHPTDRAMIGCIPPGSKAAPISSVCICVHLWFSSCFLAPCDPGEAHHCLDARFEEWNHRCTQMNWGSGRLTGTCRATLMLAPLRTIRAMTVRDRRVSRFVHCWASP